MDGDVKRWIPNANFGNPYNWDLGRPPCGDDIAVIYQESATVFLQMNTTLKELRLPKTSDILLDSNFILAFTDVPNNNADCLSNGKEIGFNKTYPSDWFDPSNWCSSETETGNCSQNVVLESEMVPCTYDDVLFPKDNTFFVNIESGMEIVVNTLKIIGKAHSTNTMSEFLNTDIGLGMFPLPYKGNRSKIRILRRPCKDPKGCICGNDKPEILQKICKKKLDCEKPACRNPIMPSGGCCYICGAKLTAEYGTGFRFDTLSDGLRRNYLDGKEKFKDVQFVITRTSNDTIQMVLTGPHGGLQSIQVATLMKTDIDQDILSGGFKYSLRKITFQQSGAPTHQPSTGARTGNKDGGSGGETAGIVIGVLVVIAAILAGLYFLYRKRSNTEVSRFKMFDRIPFRRTLKRPQVMVPPFFGRRFRSEPETVEPSHQGFDNPIYGNTPIDNEKPMDLELMPQPLESQQQPTFDTSGFDNPLYDTYVQESPFSDPTTIESDKPKKEQLEDVSTSNDN